MIKRIFLPFMCLLLCYGCPGYKEARQITMQFPWKYNGIDSLIRIDGYYYGLYGDSLGRPFILSDNGEYTGTLFKFDSHGEIIAAYHEIYPYIRKGNYQLINDTITVSTASKYGPWSYDIIKYIFVILNDTTLERIYYSHVRVEDTSVSRDRILFRFYQYPIENFE
ncbi:MAG: hypothetical protein K8F24_04400 [Bacteroidales bacterium]|nr:hypothetical protein [Bacteroidales bacterium]